MSNKEEKVADLSDWDVRIYLIMARKQINDLRTRSKLARAKLQEAFDYANGRWSEWGSRAEGTVELLEELEKILKDNTTGKKRDSNGNG